MEVRLLCVPPGGGEPDYSLDIDLPSLPQPGDYVSVGRPEHRGTADFIVRRTWWYLEHPEGSNRDTVVLISVEAEYARGPYSSEEHLHAYRRYHAQTGEERRFEESAY